MHNISARINNFPTTVVYDRSPNAFNYLSVTNKLNIPTTNNVQLMYDGNTSTAYTVQSTSQGFSGSPSELVQIIDYGQAFMNVQLSYKIGFENYGTGTANTCTVAYSEDGVTYTVLDTVTPFANEEIATQSVTLLKMRYLQNRIVATATDVNTNFRINNYEVRIMGSVS